MTLACWGKTQAKLIWAWVREAWGPPRGAAQKNERDTRRFSGKKWLNTPITIPFGKAKELFST